MAGRGLATDCLRQMAGRRLFAVYLRPKDKYSNLRPENTHCCHFSKKRFKKKILIFFFLKNGPEFFFETFLKQFEKNRADLGPSSPKTCFFAYFGRYFLPNNTLPAKTPIHHHVQTTELSTLLLVTDCTVR